MEAPKPVANALSQLAKYHAKRSVFSAYVCSFSPGIVDVQFERAGANFVLRSATALGANNRVVGYLRHPLILFSRSPFLSLYPNYLHSHNPSTRLAPPQRLSLRP